MVVVDRQLAEKLLKYTDYVEKFYYSPSGTFNFTNFNYYDNIVYNDTFNTTTNSLECINRKLKKASGAGSLPFNRCLRVLNTFKGDYMGQYEGAVANQDMNRRRKDTLNREAGIKQILENYAALNQEEQLTAVVNVCRKIGAIKKYNYEECADECGSDIESDHDESMSESISE